MAQSFCPFYFCQEQEIGSGIVKQSGITLNFFHIVRHMEIKIGIIAEFKAIF